MRVSIWMDGWSECPLRKDGVRVRVSSWKHGARVQMWKDGVRASMWIDEVHLPMWKGGVRTDR